MIPPGGRWEESSGYSWLESNLACALIAHSSGVKISQSRQAVVQDKHSQSLTFLRIDFPSVEQVSAGQHHHVVSSDFQCLPDVLVILLEMLEESLVVKPDASRTEVDSLPKPVQDRLARVCAQVKLMHNVL